MFLRKIISYALLIFISTSGTVFAATTPGAVPEKVTGQINNKADIPLVLSKISQGDGRDQYRLSKYDVINIVIIGMNVDKEAFQKIMISPDGYINLPYAGAVKLSGLTVPEATKELTERLGEYYKVSSIAIMVVEYGPRKVYVMGEVEKQGIYSLGSEYMNVFAALSSAGGITKRGRPKHIAVVRMIDGKMHLQEVNFDRFIEKQDGSQNAILQDGDMVYVPKSNKIDFNEDIMPIINMYSIYRSLTN